MKEQDKTLEKQTRWRQVISQTRSSVNIGEEMSSPRTYAKSWKTHESTIIVVVKIDLFFKKGALCIRDPVCVSFGYGPRSGIVGPYGSSIFSFFEECPCRFPQWLHQFANPPAGHRFLFPTSSPAHLFLTLNLQDTVRNCISTMKRRQAWR